MRIPILAMLMILVANAIPAQIEVSTLADLDNVRNNLTADYVLVNDIDASATADPGYNGGEGWMPIGRVGVGVSPFTGTFDGQGHTITGLTSYRPEASGTGQLVGLIARVDINAIVSNLHLKEVDIEGLTLVGGIAGGLYGSATIVNCSVSGIVRGEYDIGGLLGWQPGGTVEDCWTEGSVVLSGFSARAGGLMGQTSSTVRRSYSTCDVSGGDWIGGLVGRANTGSTIEECFATGDATGTSSLIGGLVGAQSGFITKCYATGNATALEGSFAQIGGLVGRQDAGAELRDSFARGDATGPSRVGGVLGYQRDGALLARCISNGFVAGNTSAGGLLGLQEVGTVTSSYWDTSLSGMATSGGGAGAVGLTTAEMTTPFGGGAYSGWDFVNVWLEQEEANNGYPIHQWQTVRYTLTYDAGPGGSIGGDTSQMRIPGLNGEPVTAIPDNIGYVFLQWSDGSTDNPRKELKVMSDLTVTANFGATGIIAISTLEDMDNVRNNMSGDYVLVNDIDASETADPEYNDGQGWMPIGRVEGGVADFRGSLDGQGFTISGLTFNRPATGGATGTVAGLFGGLGDPSAISNLHLVEVDFLGDDRVGGIAGHMRVLSSVTNCSVSGRIRGQTRVGGLVAYQFGGLIENCWTEGEVETSGVNQQVGGLVGYTINGTMRRSYSTSDVSGATWVGGLVGRMDGEYIVEECFATGNVFGTTSIVGGLAGDQSGLIDRCYATGNVTSVGAGIVSFGGLVGSQNSGAELRDSFARGSVTGPILLGGAVGHQNGGAIIRIFTTGSVNGNSEVGGIVGRQTSGTVTASYWDTDSSGNATSAGGAGAIGLTTAEMTTPFGGGAYVGWDFVDVWLEEEEANDGYPIHQWQTVRLTLQYAAGSGGSLEGDLEQFRIPGLSGTSVTAVPNEGFEFVKWSDDSTENPRQDLKVVSNVNVTAIFLDPNAVQSTLMIY